MAISTLCVAQSSYQFGILPSININKKLPNDWKLNLKTESRQELKSGLFDVPSSFQYNYTLTDLSTILAKKVSINKSLALGYLMRVREGELISRLIQQFIITKNYANFRLAHRFSADQTFQGNEPTEFRLRYRLSTSIPTNGQSIDPKEFYLKINNEYLNAWESAAYDLEIRIIPYLGYTFSDANKLELGLDYRLNSFLSDSSRHRFWIGVNWYVGI